MNVTEILLALFYLLVFPGFVFMAVVGLLVSWVDRKVTARVQYRVGPPLLQPVWDLLKLLGKETVMPRGASPVVFFGAPLVGLVGVVFVGVMVGMAVFFKVGFYGDLIVAIYLLMLPSLAVILGGIASKNPLASIGASREMKLMMAYELPFLLALGVPVIKFAAAHDSRISLALNDIVRFQCESGSVAGSLSGILALLVAIVCTQAKAALVPFDQAEAETEIMGGALIEYSGPALAIYKLTKVLMLYAMPMFVVGVFWGGFGNSGLGVVLGVLKYLVLVVVMTLVRNTNPRLRIEHALKFFWGPVSAVAVVAIVLVAALRW